MDHFPDHKVLELLLFYSRPRGNTNDIAHELLERFGSLDGVIDAPYRLLLDVKGIGEETATFLKVQAAFIKRYMNDVCSVKNSIQSCEDAKQYMQHRFLGDRVERVLLVCLGPGGKVIYSGSIATGTLERVDIQPSSVVKICLQVNAARAILAHNHPGGFCNPSNRDLRTTTILCEELYRVDVELIDHIIVAADGVYSMQEGGMFPKPAGPMLYVDKL